MNRGTDDGCPYDLGPQGAVVPVVLDDVHVMFGVVAQVYRVPLVGKMLSKPFQPHFFQPSSQVLDPLPYDEPGFPGEMIPPRSAVFPTASRKSDDFID